MEEIRKEVAPTNLSWEILEKDYGVKEFMEDEVYEYKRKYRDKYPYIQFYGQYGLGFDKSNPDLREYTSYPSDREYTFNSLVEELGLLERHVRDGSWRLCSCNPEKHLPLIAGLASEGYIFAESASERRFMADLRDKARSLKARIKGLELGTQEDMDGVADWARTLRHGVEARSWSLENPFSDDEPHSVLDKGLNSSLENYRDSDSRMTTVRELAGINGSVLVAEGAKRAISMVAGVNAELANIGIGAVIQLGALWKKVKKPWDLYMVVAGASLAMPSAVSYVERVVTPVPLAARLRANSINRTTSPSYVVRTNRTVETYPMTVGTAPASKYTI